MRDPDVLTRPAPPPDLTVAYGPHPDQVIDLRLPATPRPRPRTLIVVLHGGFWRVEYDRAHTGPMASALAEAGYAVAIPEFRRTGQPGGGWPGTFDDIAAALDALPRLLAEPAEHGSARRGPVQRETVQRETVQRETVQRGPAQSGTAEHEAARCVGAKHRPARGGSGAANGAPAHGGPVSGGADHGGAADSGSVTGGLAFDRIVLVGHSAGGHLALWAAARHRLDRGSPWHRPDGGAKPYPVVGLAAVADLELCSRWDLGAGAVHDLLGGPPRRYSERYAAVDPAGLVPLGVPVTLVHGSRDDRVPIAMTFEYAERARASGDEVEVVELPATDHFAVIDPLSQAWPRVLAAIAERSNPNSTPTR